VTTTLVKPAPPRRAVNGGLPARRAVARWAWRLFRREWRQQLLVLALLTTALAATTMGAGLAATSSASGLAARFGTANHLITLPGSSPTLAADLATAKRSFGTIEVVEHQNVAAPGLAKPIDLRAQDPNGVYSHPTIRLLAGRYPSGPDDVAVTTDVADIFDLTLGGTWEQGGHVRRVVGIVENPLDLLDRFALVAPGQATPPDHVTIMVRTAAQAFDAAPPLNGAQIEVRPFSEGKVAALQVLILATVGLLFVGLIAVAGFTVMAGRRLRALGMLGAIGASDRHVRLVLLANGAVVGAVAAVTGTAIGLAGWLAFAPRLETILEHRVDRFDLPWWAIGIGMALAILTAVAAAWWPARSAARVPVVRALSARPSSPRPAHRFAALGGLLIVAGVFLLAISKQTRPLPIVSGIVATTIGMLFFAPVGIAGLAAAGRRAPVAMRLALRDLARYQARSGAALAAASLAVGIAATIVISAAASQASAARSAALTGGNLPSNQMIVWLSSMGGFGDVPEHTADELQSLQARANAIAASLGSHSVLTLTGATDPSVPPMGMVGPGNGVPGKPLVQLGRPHRQVVDGETRTEYRGGESVPVFVATPEVLARYGIDPGEIDPDTDLVTSRASLTGLDLIPGRHRDWRPKIQQVDLPTYTSAPTTLLTTHAVESLGLNALPVGWLIETPKPLTDAQIDAARELAATAGVTIETKVTHASLSKLRTYAAATGVLVALCVLAMTVGLIRSETARDMRTLTATGASSTTRRTLTGATAAALGLLAAVLGTGTAYLALTAWYRHRLYLLADVPVIDLAVIIIGLPLAAAIGGWLLAGREPPAIARQPLE
jgi:putative ABC transport system permease protein